jgi:hypothetical protein
VATKFKRVLAGRWKPPAGVGALISVGGTAAVELQGATHHSRSLLTDDNGRAFSAIA